MGDSSLSDCFIAIGLAKFFNVNPKTIHRRLWARTIPACEVRRIWRIVKEDMKNNIEQILSGNYNDILFISICKVALWDNNVNSMLQQGINMIPYIDHNVKF
jgi:hypothetical protein